MGLIKPGRRNVFALITKDSEWNFICEKSVNELTAMLEIGVLQ